MQRLRRLHQSRKVRDESSGMAFHLPPLTSLNIAASPTLKMQVFIQSTRVKRLAVHSWWAGVWVGKG